MKQAFYRGSASCADRAVQRSGAILVLRIDVSPSFKQAADDFYLSFRVPSGAVYVAVRRIVQGAASTMIHGRVWIGPGRQQESSDFNAIAGGSQVQRGVSGVCPVKDLRLVQPGFINAARCEATIRLEKLLHSGAVIMEYRGKKCVHRDLYLHNIIPCGRRRLNRFIEAKPFPYFLRTVTETLDGLRTYYLQAAAGTDLRRLLARCNAACTLLNMWELGGRDDNETAIPVKALYSDAVAVIVKSENWLKERRCVFHDGKIKNTACQ